jgi:hypothetical protein
VHPIIALMKNANKIASDFTTLFIISLELLLKKPLYDFVIKKELILGA